MRPSSALLGASRLPLTPKRGNKDYYKGTGQAYVPGGGHRSGPPGKHVIAGKAKYRVVDEQVRYFVGPGREALEKAGESSSPLKPYVSTQNRPPLPHTLPALPSFSPNVQPRQLTTSISSSTSVISKTISRSEQNRISKSYKAKSLLEKQQMIMDARRNWWDALSKSYPAAVETPKQ